MGLSEPSLNAITKPFSFSCHIVKYHVIVHAVLKCAGKIIIALYRYTRKRYQR